jgi:hypothetical protein
MVERPLRGLQAASDDGRRGAARIVKRPISPAPVQCLPQGRSRRFGCERC